MSFDSYETSRQKGQSETFFHFFPVNGEQYYYTDAEKETNLTGVDQPFRPIPIVHGSIRSSGTLDKASLEIRMPRNVGLAEGFRVYPPSDVVNCVVRQRHKADPAGEALVVWTGRVIGSAWEGDELRLTCEPISTSLRRTGLRQHYQLGCPHVLYGPQCLASKLLATTPPITITAVTGTTITLPPGWIPPVWLAAGKTEEKFISGMAVWDYSSPEGPIEMKRTILRITTGRVITLAGTTKGLAVGSQVKMVLGCNHQMTDCQTIHNNIKNFGGQPWIPTKTPFGFVNNYY